MARAAVHIALNAQHSGHRINISGLEKPTCTEKIVARSLRLLWVQKELGQIRRVEQVINTKWLLERKSDWPTFEKKKHGLKQGIMDSTPWATLQLMFDINFR